eukprot:2988402-Amphidinium_carterae.1
MPSVCCTGTAKAGLRGDTCYSKDHDKSTGHVSHVARAASARAKPASTLYNLVHFGVRTCAYQAQLKL